MFSKTPKPKNGGAKIICLCCLIVGTLLFIFAGAQKIALPVFAQIISIVLFTASIYIASCYILREYTFSVESSNIAGETIPDFVIYEKRGKRSITVCRLGLDEITYVEKVDKTNIKSIQAQRKTMRRYRYNVQFAEGRFTEIRTNDNISVFITFDEEFHGYLCGQVEKYSKK